MPIQLDAKLSAFRRSSRGFFVTLEIGPDSDWSDLAAAPLGSAFGVAMVAYDPENGKRKEEPKHEPETKERPDRKRWNEMKRANQAGILCADQQFQLWLSQKMPSTEPRDCAEALRSYLGIHSRAELDDGLHDRAALRFDQLVTEYRMSIGQFAEAR